MVMMVVSSVRGAVPDPRTVSFASVVAVCLCRRVGFALGDAAIAARLALTAVARPRHVASHDNEDIKTRAKYPLEMLAIQRWNSIRCLYRSWQLVRYSESPVEHSDHLCTAT